MREAVVFMTVSYEQDSEVITGGSESGVVRAKRDRFREISDGAGVVAASGEDRREVDPRLGVTRLKPYGGLKMRNRGEAAISYK